MNKLEQAARQALEALGTLDCGDSYKTHNAATALRKALAEQTKQEPVAWMFVNDDGECEEIGYGKDYLKGSEMIADFQPLYAAPVRTKDLTDDEIWEIEEKLNRHLREFPIKLARADIAAYKEKNK